VNLVRRNPSLTLLALLALLGCVAARPARAEGVVFKFTRAVYGDDPDLKLKSPEGVGCAEDGRVVVADTGNGRLVTYSVAPDGTLANPKGIKLPEIKYPTHVELDAKGNTFVLDRKARRIARLGRDYRFAGWVEAKDRPGFVPVSFVVTAGGTIVAIDGSGPSVVELGEDGKELRRIALPRGQFTDLWVDGQGTTFALDAVGAQIWTATKGSADFKPLGRSLKDAVSFPTHVVSNGRGRLFVVDQNGMGVAILGLDGSYQGRQLALGWGAGLLYYPTQLCVTAKGIAVIADRGNNRVQVFTTLE
jgi:hypothetical protein